MRALSSFLRKVGVDHKVVIFASLQARERLKSVELSTFDPASALDVLPANTQVQLYYEICRTNLHQPLFRVWDTFDGSRVVSMSCGKFVTFDIFGKDDTVFVAARSATSMYVVVHGLL